MTRPTKPKEVKVKGENSGGGLFSGNNLMILGISVLTSVIIAAVLVVANYFILSSLIANIPAAAPANSEETDGATEHHEEEEPVVTSLFELDQKVLNLNDKEGNRYLRVRVVLEVAASEQPSETEGEAAHSGGGPPPEPEDPFEKFRPAIMDAVITILSSKSSEELLTLSGKEQAKEEIREAADAIFKGEWTVIRVNFQEFVVQ